MFSFPLWGKAGMGANTARNKHSLSTRRQAGPHPSPPPAGEGKNHPHPCPLPQVGEGVKPHALSLCYSLSRLRERVRVRGVFSFPRWGKAGMGANTAWNKHSRAIMHQAGPSLTLPQWGREFFSPLPFTGEG